MTRRIVLIVIVACLTAIVPAASAQSFTLQQVMSGTFNSELQAAPTGSLVVWMANQEGKRNVWIADLAASDFRPKELTAYNADDGQDIGDITWTPDAKSVVYVHSGDFEFPGRPDPNPALLTAGVEQPLARRIARRQDPRLSRQGRHLDPLARRLRRQA